MLEITVPALKGNELWDERNQEFIHTPSRKEQTLQLEHSLVSISKWESKWCKPFLVTKEKTTEETIDYIKYMTLTKNVDPEVYYRIINNAECVNKILDYIEAPMTATTFHGMNSKSKKKEILTSEVIYYLMFANGIPLECEKWHLNRLITLLRVFGEKNNSDGKKKKSSSELAKEYAAMNAERRKRLNTRG